MLGERVEAKYSGSDTDSDTEEYCANAHMINPVTGHVEPPRKSPFEGKFIKGFYLCKTKVLYLSLSNHQRGIFF